MNGCISTDRKRQETWSRGPVDASSLTVEPSKLEVHVDEMTFSRLEMIDVCGGCHVRQGV